MKWDFLLSLKYGLTAWSRFVLFIGALRWSFTALMNINWNIIHPSLPHPPKSGAPLERKNNIYKDLLMVLIKFGL